MIQELHKNEQYFFDDKTLNSLINFLENYNSICCLCCPTLGIELSKRKKNVTILDIDERFSDNENFIYYDLNKPVKLDKKFDIIICDPPFNIVKISQVFNAIKILSYYNFEQKILISFQKRREHTILGIFSNFSLVPTNFLPTYRSIVKSKKFNFEFYGNLDLNELERLNR
jgi:hypothetical protein